MRVQFSVVGTVERFPSIWADLDAVPREGETVNLPGVPPDATFVRTVVWYPLGQQGDPEFDNEGADPTPFVYVVVGQRRP